LITTGNSTSNKISDAYILPFGASFQSSHSRFITPADMLAGRQAEIHAARDRKLEEARQQRQKRRQQRREQESYNDFAR